MEEWNDSKFDDSDLEAEVSTVIITAYGNENNDKTSASQPPTNMWAIFLQTGDSESVMLYNRPEIGSNDKKGYLTISSRDYVGTYNSVKTVTFPTTGEPTVKNIVDLIISRRRDKFYFNEHWEGCRHWVSTVLNDLEEEGMLGAGTQETALNALWEYWRHPPGTGSNARELNEGTFY